MIKLLQAFKKQLAGMDELRYAWFTSFNINIEFIETYLLPAVLGMEPPRNRMDYEHFQLALNEKGKVHFQLPFSRDGDSLDSEPANDVQVVINAERQDISYFRLFQAMHQYSQKLDAIRNGAELDRWVFGRPGSLLELVNKARERIAASNGAIFEWFLAQEVQLLCRRAKARKGELRSEIGSDRWNALKLELPPLPVGIPEGYLQMIRKGCGYGGQ